MNSHMGLALLRAGRFDEALAQFKKTIALDPNYVRVYQHMGYAYEWHRMLPEAIAAYRKGVSLAGETLEVQADLARALIEGGEREQGTRILRHLEAESASRYISPVDLAGIYTALEIAVEHSRCSKQPCSSATELCCTFLNVSSSSRCAANHGLPASLAEWGLRERHSRTGEKGS